jgi:sulfite oxidase
VLVPGYIGARSVKWLAEISVQAEPSANYFHVHSYKVFPRAVRPDNADWDSVPALGETLVNAVVCEPIEGAVVSPGLVNVRGYAVGSAGRTVERVQVSSDGGMTWQEAQLTSDQGAWAWRFWEVAVDLTPGSRELVARAWDSAGATQPADPASIWNFKGYMNNAWHRVHVVCTD